MVNELLAEKALAGQEGAVEALAMVAAQQQVGSVGLSWRHKVAGHVPTGLLVNRSLATAQRFPAPQAARCCPNRGLQTISGNG